MQFGLPVWVRVIKDHIFCGHSAAGQQPADNGPAHIAGADEPQRYCGQFSWARFRH
jgi:hypothetical protein